MQRRCQFRSADHAADGKAGSHCVSEEGALTGKSDGQVGNGTGDAQSLFEPSTSGSNGFSGWDVENVRLTIFHPEREPEEGLWETFGGLKPESIESKPRGRVLKEQGSISGQRLVLISGSERHDWRWQPLPSEPTREPLPGPEVLPGDGPAIDVLQSALSASLSRHRRVIRLALGIDLVQQATGLESGFALLSSFLPRLELEVHGDRDFMYRINRRRRSLSARHVVINRLASWLLEEIVGSLVRLPPSGPPQITTDSPMLLIKLSLDINTVPGQSAVSAGKMPGILSECMAFAQEIAVEGDIP